LAQAATAAGPYTAALVKLRRQLMSLAHSYPPVAQGVNRMVAAVDKLLAALNATHSNEFFSPGPWAQTVITDASSIHPIALQIRKELKAPMPGLVVKLLCQPGDTVEPGQPLAVLRAMKMENDITSPRDGRVTGVHITQGATVEGGKPLVTIEA